MRKTLGWFVAFLAIGAAIALLFYWAQPRQPVDQRAPPPASEVSAPAPVVAEPQISYPIPTDQAQDSESLPKLEDSDTALQQALAALIGSKSVAEFVRLPDLVRRIVVTVDNLPRKKVAQRLLPLKNVSGRFLVSGEPGHVKVHQQNGVRYAAYVRLAEAIDTKKLVDLYVRFYSLFQQAYQDLGYPKAYFNDRLVNVIDDLLAAPELKDAPRLVQPKVMYEFADAELEALSAGQKIMIRMGSANAVRIKARLRAVRAELVSLNSNRPG